ncbi:MAG: restriction endonuclease subunit S [Tannerellaceae bacterium]|nr:restriction endonuclease subunit S [Tannerellaceae bacterium]
MLEPKIRFIGFEGAWNTFKLNNIMTFNKGRGYFKSDLCDVGHPIILYGRMYTNYQFIIDDIDIFVNRKDNSVLSKGGEILIPASGETPDDIACASVVKQKGIILGGDLNILTLDDCFSSPFAALSLTYGSSHQELVKGAQGKSIVHLHNSAIAKASITFPSTLPEQQQIASYFKSLDSLIQETTKKISSLKQLKSASLQSMFPQAGETKPRVRFKGFEGEWVKKKLSDCLEVSKDRNLDGIYGRNDVLSVSDDFGVMNQIELLGRSYAGKSVSNYGVLRTGEIVYTKSPLKSKPFGIIKQNMNKTGIVSVLYAIYKVKEGTAAEYIHYYFDPEWRLNAYIRPLVNKGAKNTMNISDETALTGSIWIPASLDEQQQIANFFRSLDTQISLETQRLEKLKQIKSACLDKMFV